jgi:hypothetical protein
MSTAYLQLRKPLDPYGERPVLSGQGEAAFGLPFFMASQDRLGDAPPL